MPNELVVFYVPFPNPNKISSVSALFFPSSSSIPPNVILSFILSFSQHSLNTKRCTYLKDKMINNLELICSRSSQTGKFCSVSFTLLGPEEGKVFWQHPEKDTIRLLDSHSFQFLVCILLPNPFHWFADFLTLLAVLPGTSHYLQFQLLFYADTPEVSMSAAQDSLLNSRLVYSPGTCKSLETPQMTSKYFLLPSSSDIINDTVTITKGRNLGFLLRSSLLSFKYN